MNHVVVVAFLTSCAFIAALKSSLLCGRQLDNPELRWNKPNPAPAGDPTMAKPPLVALLHQHAIARQVEP
jgi:hypothetical protein